MSRPLIPQKLPYVVNLERGEYLWCACGRSTSQPFCDGSHVGTDQGPVKFAVSTKPVTEWLCGCKQSKRPPYCDGQHKKLV